MAMYMVLAPASRVGDAAADPMKTVFIRDGFSWAAFLIAVPWMLYRRMWLVLLGYVIAATGLAFALRSVGDDMTAVVMVLASILFALEANNFRRWTLERRGHRLIGLAEGRNMEEAEVRFFSNRDLAVAPAATWAPIPPVPPNPAAPPVPPVPPRVWASQQPSAEAGDVVGLFPAPASPKGSS